MGKDTFPIGSSFCRPDGVGDGRAKHLQLGSVGFSQKATDFPGVIGPAIYHSQQDAVDLQLRIDLLADFVDGLKQLLQTFGGQILGLDRNEDTVCVQPEY